MTDFFSSLQPWHFYFAVGVVLLALEMLTFTFDLLWLGLGALAGAVVAWLVPDTTWLPMLTSAVFAVALTLAGRRWMRKGMNNARGYHDPIDSLINRQGKVLEAIAPHRLGIVRVGSETWSAASAEVIAPGEEVVILSRSNTVVQVRRVEKTSPAATTAY